MFSRFFRRFSLPSVIRPPQEPEVEEPNLWGVEREREFHRRRFRPPRTDPRFSDDSVMPGHNDVPAGGTSGSEMRGGGGARKR